MEPQLSVTGIIVVMGIAGATGGFVNYFFLSKEQREEWTSFFASIIGGLAASFLMPLFLRMISSNLVSNLLDTEGIPDASGNLQPKGTFEDVLVFAGFCLLAAISSKKFIQTLYERLLAEVREAKKRTKELEEEVDEIEDTVSPLVEIEDTQDEEIPTEAQREFLNLTETQQGILKALDSSRYTLRSPSGLARELEKKREEVLHELKDLRDKGFVREMIRKKGGIRWSLSASGRVILYSQLI